MEELIETLKKLGATVEHDIQGFRVNGQRIIISFTSKGYEIGMKKKTTSVKNAAYYILTEYLPRRKTLEELRVYFDKLKEKIPAKFQIRMMDNEVRFVVATKEEFAEFLNFINS